MSRAPGLYVGLTIKQAELLSFVRIYVASHPYSPSFEEMKEAVNLSSKSGVHRLVSALEERGYVTRLENRARSIMPLDKPKLPEKQLASAHTMSTGDLVGELKCRGFRFTGSWA